MEKAKRIVVKVGTRMLTGENGQLDPVRVSGIVTQIADLHDKGVEIALVSSGAIGAGMGVLGIKKRPNAIHELQAVAAIGQNRLMSHYSEQFARRKCIAAQVLLTQGDFDDRKRYLNIKATLNEIIGHRVIPIINENDTVATDEIRCGDNDRISSLVADIIEADMLVILTDVDGFLDERGCLIRRVDEVTNQMTRLVRAHRSELSRGGMATKLEAAERAMRAGIECVIANGQLPDVLDRAVFAKDIGTIFGSKRKYPAKKRWIAFASKTKGTVIVDNGAAGVLKEKNTSLLASGVIGTRGSFNHCDVVSVADAGGREFARGVTNYSSEELNRVKGMKSAQIKNVLSGKKQYEVIHKDNLVIL